MKCSDFMRMGEGVYIASAGITLHSKENLAVLESLESSSKES